MAYRKLHNMHRGTEHRTTCAVLIKGQHVLCVALLVSLILWYVGHVRHLNVQFFHETLAKPHLHVYNSQDIPLADSPRPGQADGAARAMKTTPSIEVSSLASADAGADRVMQTDLVTVSSLAAPLQSSAPGTKPPAAVAVAAVPLVTKSDTQRGMQLLKESSTEGVAISGALTGVNKAPGVPAFMYRYVERGSTRPLQLKYPLWWFGPFWSGSGYGSGETSCNHCPMLLSVFVPVLYLHQYLTPGLVTFCMRKMMSVSNCL